MNITPREQAVQSMFIKVINGFQNLETSYLLTLVIIFGLLALIMGSISESIVNTNSLLIAVIISIGVYIYLKKQYSYQLDDLRKKYELLKKDTIMDDICKNNSSANKLICQKYNDAKRNFYTISNLLLQQMK
jgi:hypothetical protein